MHVITSPNVNQAFAEGVFYLLNKGERESSRNGDVLVAPGPVCTVYENPNQRVLFCPKRDANPFFHLMEALWMLAGRNDVAFPVIFNKTFGQFSDNRETYYGAYGFRWRKWFGYDQLDSVVSELRKSPNSRRAVLAMWDATYTSSTHPGDLPYASLGGLDAPCNTHAYFDLRHGMLNMTVCNRSNDVMWGAYGSNVVHFSMLQEFIAARLNVPVGVYRQISNNFHIYLDKFPEDRLYEMAVDAAQSDLYLRTNITHIPLVRDNEDAEDFITEVQEFIKAPEVVEPKNAFLAYVAVPMVDSWMARKRMQNSGLVDAQNILSIDWRTACTEWINRRENRG